MDLTGYLFCFLAGILISLAIRINAARKLRTQYLQSINDSLALAKDNASLRETSNSLDSTNRKLKAALLRAHKQIEKSTQVPSLVELLVTYGRRAEAAGADELETAEVVPLKN